MEIIDIYNIKSRTNDYVIDFTVSGISNFSEIACFINNETDNSLNSDQLDERRIDLSSHIQNLQDVGKSSFIVKYDDYNIINDNSYSFYIKVLSVVRNNTDEYLVGSIVSNTVVQVRDYNLITPHIYNVISLDNAIQVELSGNEYKTMATLINFKILNNTHRLESGHNKITTFNIANQINDRYIIDLSHNADLYEINCQTIQYIDASYSKFSGLSNTVIGKSINSSNPVSIRSEVLEDDSSVTANLLFVNDWDTGHDDYANIRVFVYDSSSATTEFISYDLSTNLIYSEDLSYNISIPLNSGQTYQLHYATKNIDNLQSNISDRTTNNSNFTGFSEAVAGAPNNITFVNTDIMKSVLSWRGTHIAGLNSDEYEIMLYDEYDSSVNSYQVTPDMNVNNYSYEFTELDFSAGLIYYCTITAKYSSNSAGSQVNNFELLSLNSQECMPYKVIDGTLQVTDITTAGENVLVSFTGSNGGTNGLFPFTYNIELVYKDGDGNFINVIDNTDTTSDYNLNQYIDAIQVKNMPITVNFTTDMVDHQYDSSNSRTTTQVSFMNFNDSTIGTEYSAKIITNYRDFQDVDISYDIVINVYDTSSTFIQTYVTNPSYTGDISLIDVSANNVTFEWPVASSQEGLSFSKYDVILIDISGSTETEIAYDGSYNNINDTTGFFENLVNGNNYYIRVRAVYLSIRNGFDTPATVNSNFITSENTSQGTPYKNFLLDSNQFNVSSTSIPRSFTDSVTNSLNTNIRVNWVSDPSALEGNIINAGLLLKKITVKLIPQGASPTVITHDLLDTDYSNMHDLLSVNHYIFENVGYNNNGYKCSVTMIFRPEESDINISNRNINGKEIVSDVIVIPFDGSVTNDTNFQVSNLLFNSFTNDLSGTHSITVNWTGLINNSAALSKGLTFKSYYLEISRTPFFSGADEFYQFINIADITQSTFTFHGMKYLPYNVLAPSYVCNVQCVFDTLDLVNTSLIIGSNILTSNRLIPYDTDILDLYKVSNVRFTNHSDSLLTVGWDNYTDLLNEIREVGLSFKHFKIELLDATTNVVVTSKTMFQTDSTITAHTFTVDYNNNGYQCRVTTVFRPLNVSHNFVMINDIAKSTIEVISQTVGSTVKVIPFDDNVTDDANFQVTNVGFSTINGNVTVSWSTLTGNSTFVMNKGLFFTNYYVEIFRVDTNEVLTDTTLTDILANNFTFSGVNLNIPIRCRITTRFTPFNIGSSIVNGGIVNSLRTFIPFVSDISNNYIVTDVSFTDLINQSFNINWNVYAPVSDFEADGLKFENYEVQIFDTSPEATTVNNIIITDINQQTVRVTNIPYTLFSYKCRIITSFSPLDVGSVQIIKNKGAVSDGVIIPYTNNILNNRSLNINSVAITSFENNTDLNNITVDVTGVVSNNDAKLVGLVFKHYKVDLNSSDLQNNYTVIETVITNTNILFTGISYNSSGYKCNITCVYNPLDTLYTEHINSLVISSPGLFIPYKTDISNDLSTAVSSPQFGSFLNVSNVNNIDVNWTLDTNFNNYVNSIGLTFVSFKVDLLLNNIIIGTPIIVNNINTNTSTFTNVPYNSIGYKVQVTPIFRTQTTILPADLIGKSETSSRTFIPYKKDITISDIDIDIAYSVINELQFTASWRPVPFRNLTNVGLNFHSYRVDLYNSTNKMSSTEDVSGNSITYNNLIISGNSYYVQVFPNYRPFDVVGSSELITVNNYDDYISDVMDIDIFSKAEEFIKVTNIILTQQLATTNLVNLNVDWTDPLYTNGNLYFNNTVIKLYKYVDNSDLVGTLVASNILTNSSLSSFIFTNISYSAENRFKAEVKLNLDTPNGDIVQYNGVQISNIIYPTITTNLITNQPINLSLLNNVHSDYTSIKLVWTRQPLFVGNYKFLKYNIVVNNNETYVDLVNVDITNHLVNQFIIEQQIPTFADHTYTITPYYTPYVEGVLDTSVEVTYSVSDTKILENDIEATIVVGDDFDGNFVFTSSIKPFGNVITTIIISIFKSIPPETITDNIFSEENIPISGVTTRTTNTSISFNADTLYIIRFIYDNGNKVHIITNAQT